jgi:aryl-alcohol dehydrogenase-like predicted oxidoreductase
MNLNKKFIIGLAQSDPKYGLDKKNKIETYINKLKDYNFKSFDTAESYINSEKIMQGILLKNKKKVITKISLKNYNKYSRYSLNQKIKNILKNNQINQIYGLLIHDPMTLLNNKNFNNILIDLKVLKSKGYIKKIGISVYNKSELKLILDVFKPEIIQFPLNVFNQSFDDDVYLRRLKKVGIELHVRSIFLQGILLKNYINYPYFIKWSSNFKNWKKFLNKNKLTPLNACLRYVLKNKCIDHIVIGLKNKKQFLSFKYELIKISKSKQNYDFSHLKTDEVLLNDPRYWKKL